MDFNTSLIENYWNKYVGGFEDIPDHLDGLDDYILDSWRRSKHKANPFEANPKPLTNEELANLMVNNERLIKVALPYMIKFYEVAKNATQNVLLTDATGKQLTNVSSDNKNLMHLMSKASVFNGIDYSEDVCGTSSVSLSLHEDKPILLRGAEHYRKIYHDLACFSAPIHSLSNKQVGCICITGQLKNYQPFIMSALIVMIEAIENELHLSETNDILNKVVNNIRSGFILINSDLKIILHNEQAKHIFEIDAELTDHKLSEFFITDLTALLKEFPEKCILKKNNGVPINLSIKIIPIFGVGTEDLFLLIFSSLNDFNNEVSIQVGYTAKYGFKDIAGDSEDINKLKELAFIAAKTNSNVLIEGESGTGKEFFAQAIHNDSSRKRNPFITVNCSSIPMELLDIELFGDDEGYQMGKLELANGGTLFLNEVDELTLQCQSKLFEFLNTKKMKNNKTMDVRIIVSTNKDLLYLVKQNRFRDDLYYKLNIINISIPPLRKRRSDILVHINLFINRYSKLLRKEIKGIEKDCLALLMNYNWPGNIRQLESVIEQMVNMSKGKYIKYIDLPDTILKDSMIQKYTDSSIHAFTSPETMEYGKILELMKQEHGHMKTIAKNLDIPLSTLYRKCTKYNIDPKLYREW